MPAKVVLKMHQSLDGFVCTETGSNEWLFPHMDEHVLAWEVARLSQASVHVMGKNLYEIMASYWPTSDEPPAKPMNEIPKVVFSKSLQAATWGPVRIARNDVVEEIPKLKQQADNDVFVHGGASFAQSLSRHNLVDEYRLLIHPVTLGSGKPSVGRPLNLRLISSETFPSGVVALTYARLN